MNSNKLWIDNPSILLSLNPSEWNPITGPIEQKINATTKLCIIASIFFSILKHNKQPFMKTAIIIAIISGVYVYLQWKTEKFTQETTTPAPPTCNKIPTCNKMPLSHENPMWNQLPPVMEDTTICKGELDRNAPAINDLLCKYVPNDQSSFFYGNSNCTRPFYKVPEISDNDIYKNFLYGDAFSHNTFKQGSVYAHLGSPYERLTKQD